MALGVSREDLGRFLDQIGQVPYPLKERFLDLTSLIKQILSEMVFESGSHPTDTIRVTWGYFFDEEPDGLTKESLLEQEESSIRGKLLFVLEKTQELAKKMGIATRIKVVLVDGEDIDSCAEVEKNHHFSILRISETFLNHASFEEIAFVLAHELAHIQHHHGLKSMIFDWMVTAIYLLAFLKLKQTKTFVATLFIIKGIASIVALYLERCRERAADQSACRCLNSSQGIVDFIVPALIEHLSLKYPNSKLVEFIKQEMPEYVAKYSAEDLKRHQQALTPHGDNREDFEHLSLTERLRYALNFQPTPS